LNLIEPWWKTLKSLAFKGRRFESWEQVEEAVRDLQRPTGMSIAIPLCGDAAGGIALAASLALPACHWRPELSGCTT